LWCFKQYVWCGTILLVGPPIKLISQWSLHPAGHLGLYLQWWLPRRYCSNLPIRSVQGARIPFLSIGEIWISVARTRKRFWKIRWQYWYRPTSLRTRVSGMHHKILLGSLTDVSPDSYFWPLILCRHLWHSEHRSFIVRYGSEEID
jgi:hypothetical protein